MKTLEAMLEAHDFSTGEIKAISKKFKQHKKKLSIADARRAAIKDYLTELESEKMSIVSQIEKHKGGA